MGTQRGQMAGALSWLVRWACRAGTRDFCSALAALVGLVQKICFLAVHNFNAFVPSPSKMDRQPCWVTCLLVCVSGYKTVKDFSVKDGRSSSIFQSKYLQLCLL
jgi:hypothetical protein